MIGAKLMGLWGSLLAVPVLAVVQIIVSDITASSEKS
jgi:predicted PurR-regulated permease PerM